LAPFEGAMMLPGYYSPRKNEVREAVNDWIRKSRDIDGYFDFDRAVADPTMPNRLSTELDSCDHLHPSDAGERALSEAIDLSSFE